MENYNIETTILRNLLCNEKYLRKVLPYIKPEYFEGITRQIFKDIGTFVSKYNKLPSFESFKIELSGSDAYNDEKYAQAVEMLPNIFNDEPIDEDWLFDATEKWCQDRALFNAVMESITIIDGKHTTLSKNALPDILSKALAVSFDSNVGHDYIDDVVNRYDYYNNEEEKIPFDLEMLNTITNGGISKKSLLIFLAGTGVGKSLIMCHCAGAALMQGKNVLYITMEMAEEKIAERIDANILNVPINEIENLPREQFLNKVSNVSAKTNGKLIIKEYPTGAANASHFRALLNELKLKKGFKPDIIFIDYLNICASARMKAGGNINSYTYVKSIAEELRGLGVEFDLPIVSATQTTRSGYGSSDPGLEDTSESFGLPATADMMLALISSEELENQGQIVVKQLKNRYNNVNNPSKFLLGIDRVKMRLYDLDNPYQDLVDNTNVYDNTQSSKYDVLDKIQG